MPLTVEHLAICGRPAQLTDRVYKFVAETA